MHIQHWIRGSTVHTEDTDTADDWLGIPTPLETARQHALLLENEVAELNLQLRAARENIYKLVNMQAQTEQDRDEALARLREKAGEAALLRKQVSDLELSVRSKDRANEDLRRQIPAGARGKLR
ncbi:hypothetical protein [Pseudomonas protegens]|uniref:hypothetical protein n=1 Tax=Pseudomonas protegens TaxID=380021 RepID=UPI001B327D05|nr:hypothetical protein [Pseudomonas protegens]MBP5132208.1 hypothetical protein [Pseudomonas protegens]